MPKDLVFVFGSENDGVSASLLAACCDVLAIPMYGINHSYPVAIAAGMVLCEWARRRDPLGRLPTRTPDVDAQTLPERRPAPVEAPWARAALHQSPYEGPRSAPAP